MNSLSGLNFRPPDVLRAFDRCPPIVRSIIDDVEHMCFGFFSIIPCGSSFEGTQVDASADIDLMLILPISFFQLFPPIPFSVFTMIKLNEHGFLKATSVKMLFRHCVEMAVLQSSRHYGDVVFVEEHGPAVTLKITTPNGRHISVDLTLAIRVQWPVVAEEWTTRPRVWPDQYLLQQIVFADGCHLVAKKPTGNLIPEDYKDFCWKFSFSAAEMSLFNLGGIADGNQNCLRQVLRKLKAFGPYLKPLSSYHFKTICFYLREMTHSCLWRYDYCEERLKNLLLMLENCLTFPPCPHFFIKTFNLFEEFSPFIRRDLINKVRDLRMYLETPVVGNVIQAPGGVFIR